MNHTNSEKNERLANEIKNFLVMHDIALDTCIYYNHKSITNGHHVVENGVNPKDCIEYANPDTVTMSFEGSLYHIINYGNNPKLLEKFDKIFEKHKCYYELGYAWSLSVYYL